MKHLIAIEKWSNSEEVSQQYVPKHISDAYPKIHKEVKETHQSPQVVQNLVSNITSQHHHQHHHHQSQTPNQNV